MFNRLALIVLALILFGVSSVLADEEWPEIKKAIITIETLDSETADCQPEQAAAIGGILVEAFATSDLFLGIDGIPNDGKVRSDLLLSGSVTKFEPELAGTVQGGSDALIGLYLQLSEARTNRVIKRFKIHGDALSLKNRKYPHWSGQVEATGGLASFKGKPMESALSNLADKLIYTLRTIVPNYTYIHDEKDLAEWTGQKQSIKATKVTEPDRKPEAKAPDKSADSTKGD